MGSIEDKQIVGQTNVESSEPDSQEESAKNVHVVMEAADESAKENAEPNSLDANTKPDSESNEAGQAEENNKTKPDKHEQQSAADKQDESVKRDQSEQIQEHQQQHQNQQQDQCHLNQDHQSQQHQQPMINCEVMQSTHQKRATLDLAEKSVQFGEPEISSTTPSANNSATKPHRGGRGYTSRRQQGRNYVTGSYQNNYGLLHLPYKSNFEPSEAARRRADEFFKSLNVSTN